MEGPVRTETREGGVLVITIDRPAARNAIDRATAEGIAAALDRLDGDPQRRVRGEAPTGLARNLKRDCPLQVSPHRVATSERAPPRSRCSHR